MDPTREEFIGKLYRRRSRGSYKAIPRQPYIPDQTALSRRDKDLRGVDEGHKGPPELSGPPRQLSEKEIDEIRKINPWGYFWKKDRKTP